MFKKLVSTKPIAVDIGILLLRLYSLFLMYQGWDKVVNFDAKSTHWPDPFHIGGAASLSLTIFAELFCPVLIILGWFTRIALMPAIFNMIMAILIGHIGQPFLAREHAFSFLVPFIVIFLMGPGRYSIDAALRK